MLEKLDTVTTISSLTNEGEWINPPVLSGFALKQRAQFATVEDLITDAPASIAVFKGVGDETTLSSVTALEKGEGVYFNFATKVSNKGEVAKYFDDLIIKSDCITSAISTDAFARNPTPITNVYYNSATSSTVTAFGYKTIFSIPATATLNETPYSLTAYFTKDFIDTKLSGDEITYGDIFEMMPFENCNSYSIYTSLDISRGEAA